MYKDEMALPCHLPALGARLKSLQPKDLNGCFSNQTRL
jgi:hypothetical protein